MAGPLKQHDGTLDPAAHDPYAALRVRDYRFFLTGNVLANLGMRMQGVAVGWEIYERTGSAMALGWIGLVQVLPVIALALPAGHVADHFSRRRTVMLMTLLIGLGSVGLAVNSIHYHSVPAIYACLLLTGVARAFQQPARASLLPLLVPTEKFSNAVMWNTGGFNLAASMGPAIGGQLIAHFVGAMPVYVVDAACALFFFAMLASIARDEGETSKSQKVKKSKPFSRDPLARPKPLQRGEGPQGSASTLSTQHSALSTENDGEVSLRSMLAGAEFVWRNKIILGAITLDMFAVLLGGAVSLLPIYAKDILHVGPRGLGLMVAAPFIGALLMSFLLAYRPPMQKAGTALLWAVAGFGVATIVFGFSRSFWLSLFMLFLTGALDDISVVIRHTLVQLLTPDAMRGRVSAINGLFIGASNELGGFESGLVAALTSPTFSVVSGGIGTIVVVAAVALLWPPLRRYGKLGVPVVAETLDEHIAPNTPAT